MSESTRSESMTLGTEQTWDTNRELSELTPSPVETQPTVSKRVRIDDRQLPTERRQPNIIDITLPTDNNRQVANVKRPSNDDRRQQYENQQKTSEIKRQPLDVRKQSTSSDSRQSSDTHRQSRLPTIQSVGSNLVNFLRTARQRYDFFVANTY